LLINQTPFLWTWEWKERTNRSVLRRNFGRSWKEKLCAPDQWGFGKASDSSVGF
jgi:hypothetical protein